MSAAPHVVALAGGVGGARLLDGLAAELPPERLTCIVNTGDDFEHLGLWISPDVDTVMYTLAGLAHEQRGWGLAEETFSALSMIEGYGGPGWFQLGDRDLGTHLARTTALAAGERLTTVTERLCRSLGVRCAVRPMADRPRRTFIDTEDDGTLPFQDWLVRQRAGPVVRRVWYEGTRTPAPEVVPAIERADLVVICPSNPYVSIDPILTLDGVADAIAGRPVVGVSPIVSGRAVKGPLASMIEQLASRPPSAAAVAEHYRSLLAGFVVEPGDEDGIGVPVLSTPAVMRDRVDRARLARQVLAFARELP